MIFRIAQTALLAVAASSCSMGSGSELLPVETAAQQVLRDSGYARVDALAGKSFAEQQENFIRMSIEALYRQNLGANSYSDEFMGICAMCLESFYAAERIELRYGQKPSLPDPQHQASTLAAFVFMYPDELDSRALAFGKIKKLRKDFASTR